MSTTNGERRDYAAQVVPTVFAELLEDRRVLFIGAADEDLCERLSERCRALRVLDTSAARSRRRPKGYRASAFRPGALGFGEGSFDAVVVPDVAVFGADVTARLGELARVVGPGLLIAGTRPGGLAHDALFEALDRHFEHTRLFGELPFSGVAVADLEADERVEVVVDATLAPPSGTPHAFVAVGSGSRLRITEYTVLALEAAPAVRAEASDALREELEAAVEHAEALEVTVGRLEAALRTREVALEAAKRSEREAREAVLAARAAAPRAERAEARVEAPRAEARAEAPRVHAGPSDAERQLQRELAELEAKLVERGGVVRALEAEIERRGLLVRDAVEETRRLRRLGAGEPPAVQRALAAEAARAAAQFEADELRLRLRAAESGAAPDSSLAELEERHQLTLARLQLAENSIESRRERERELTGALARATSERDAARAEGEAACAERDAARAGGEKALAAARSEAATALDAARNERDKALAAVRARPAETELEARVAELTESEGRLSRRVGELSNQLTAARDLAAAAAAPVPVAAPVSVPAPVPVAAPVATSAADPALDAARERLEGQVVGLRFRLDNAERAFAARVGALAEDKRRLEAAAVLEGDRARDLEATLQTNLALTTRIQLELAEQEQELRALEDQRARHRQQLEEMHDRISDAVEANEAREAAERALADADARAAAAREQADQLEAEKAALSEQVLAMVTELAEKDEAARTPVVDPRLAPLESQAAALREEVEAVTAERDSVRALLAETRASLEGLRAGHDAAPRALPSSSLENELRDRDTMIRSLTSQLEERNDRMRALERRLSGSVPPGPLDDEQASRQLLELSERALRLSEEVTAERDARAAAETRLDALERRPSAEAELDHLRVELGQSQAELDSARGRAEGLERDVRSLRDVCGEARQGLEVLLGDATSAGEQDTADRLGRLLTLLGTY